MVSESDKRILMFSVLSMADVLFPEKAEMPKIYIVSVSAMLTLI